MQVTDTRSGHMRIMSTVDIPALQPGNISSGSSGVITSKPVVKLWPDGRRVAVGNAKPGAVWILDLQKAGHVTELAGRMALLDCRRCEALDIDGHIMQSCMMVIGW